MAERGESMETAARHERHVFFASCARKHRCRRVLLAHHADDQAETVLWNLLRGSHGLKGMRARQEIAVGRMRLELVRPLLGMRRAELAGWLRERGLRWREDAGNREPVAVRNRLRHEVFPLLESIAGRDPVGAFARAAEDAAAAEVFENSLLDEARTIDPQGRLHLPVLRKLPGWLQKAALRSYFRRHAVPDVDRALVVRAAGLLDTAGPAVVNLPGGRRLRRKAGRLWIAD
jgi:tRNA(Ile)-lysidine synthase